MEVSEVVAKREELRKRVFDLVKKFETDTGTRVEELSVDRYRSHVVGSPDPVSELAGISVEVRI